MHRKQILTFTGISALGAAALLLGGCGGSSFQKNTFGNYPETLPYAYGIEPVAFYGANSPIGAVATIEGSGLQAATGGQAYITGTSSFTVVAAGGAALAAIADPNGTGSLPLGFSLSGLYVDAVNQTGLPVATVTSVAPGTSVVFRAALANGISSNTASGISGATLTSTDPALAAVPGLTAGLPMTLDVVGGAFSNATYVTGTGGAAAPFTIPPGTTTGLHTATVTVSDSAARKTATTFIFPVVAPTDVALFAQGIVTAAPTTADPTATALTAFTPGDTVTLDGGAGIGTYPTGYSGTVADAQGTVVLFTTPGTHTITETDSKGVVVQTSTFTIAADAVGTTLFDVPVSETTTTSESSRPRIIPRAAKRIVKH